MTKPTFPHDLVDQFVRKLTEECNLLVGALAVDPDGHTRCPRYTRGRLGVIQKHHGVHHFQDDVDGDVGQQHLYTVAFTATELWGERANPNDRIHAELWEYHLEAIT